MLSLIQKSGVSVFSLSQEPAFVKNSSFDWVLNLQVKDKRVLNILLSKIEFRQTHL